MTMKIFICENNKKSRKVHSEKLYGNSSKNVSLYF